MLNKRMIGIAASVVLVFVSANLSSCAAPEPSRTEFVLGTVCTVSLFDKGKASIYSEIFARLREIETRMSANTEDSEVAEINRNAGIKPTPVHADLVELVSIALKYAEASGGAFDPTIGPLVKLWGIGSDSARVPTRPEIDAVLPLVDYRDLSVDRPASTVYLRRTGMRLDLGAAAKGYAADELVEILVKHKIPRAIIDLGGNVLVYGEKKGGLPWRVGVQDPTDDRGDYIGVLTTKNKTLVTSGVYERFLEVDGKRYHHILETKTGYPVENGLLSVTIVADASVDADCLSTAVFALGAEQGKQLVESMAGIEAVFVWEDRTVRITPGLEGVFSLADSRFTLAGW